MFHKLTKNVLAAAGTITANCNNSTMNGLVIHQTIKPTVNDYLTVNLKSSKHDPVVLVPRINLLALAEISDTLYGFSFQLHAEEQLHTGHTTQNYFATVVDLGCLKNGITDSQIEVILELSAAQTVGIYTYYIKEESDHFYQYTQSYTLTDTARDITRAFVHTSSAITADSATRDVTFLVSSEAGSASCDLWGLQGATNGLSQIEATGELQTLLLYQAPDKVGSTIQYTVSGAASNTFSVISMRNVVMSKRVSLGMMDSADKLTTKIKGMNEDRERGLRRSGIIPKLNTVEATRQRMNVE